jgi:hypothetical protein
MSAARTSSSTCIAAVTRKRRDQGPVHGAAVGVVLIAKVSHDRSVSGQKVQRVAPPGSIVETDVADRGVMR